MRKLGLIVLVFSFLMVIPKVASAFTLLEVDVTQMKYSVFTNKYELLVRDSTGATYTVEADPATAEILGVAISNLAVQKGRTNTYLGLEPIVGSPNLEIRSFWIGDKSTVPPAE